MAQTVAIDVKLKGTYNSHELLNQMTQTVAIDVKPKGTYNIHEL